MAGRGVTGEIGPGLLILICAMQGDGEAEAEALVVSPFTLAADTSRGNRPGFSAAAPPDEGRRLYERFSSALRGLGAGVANGEFGADMQVALVNDGPGTIWMDTADRARA